MPENALETLQCRILTPERTVFDGPVLSMEVYGTGGAFELLPRHEPLMTPLAIGLLTVETAAGTLRFAVHAGFLDTDGTHAVILADAAEAATDLDVQRAHASLQRAKERLEKVTHARAQDVQIDIDRAKLALARASMRIRLLEEMPREE